MIYPDVTVAEWSKKYNLVVKEDWDCPSCGKKFQLNVPIFMQGMAGLSTPVHECGENFTSVLLTPATEKAKAFWYDELGLGKRP